MICHKCFGETDERMSGRRCKCGNKISLQKIDYLKLLNHSFECEKSLIIGLSECVNLTRLSYLSDFVFDFTTYDNEMDGLLGRKAVDVCESINNMTTFEYIKGSDNYKWF